MTVPIKGGRPKAFNSVEEMQEKITDYFNYCDSVNVDDDGKVKINKPYTMEGLCVYLDIHADTWSVYSKKPEFTDTCKKARKRVEAFVIEKASINKLNPIVSIFNLKNNFGWTDKIEVNTNSQPEQLNMGEVAKKIEELRKNKKE